MNKKPNPLIRKLFERTLSTQQSKITARLAPLKSSGDQNKPSNVVNCRNCTNFYISWKKDTPFGCRAHGFISAQMPSIVVFSSSGEHCLLFTKKD